MAEDLSGSDLVKGGYPYNPIFLDFVTFLGIKAEKDPKGVKWDYDDRLASKIEDIYVWGKIKSKSLDPERIKLEVFKLNKRVGVNWIGKALVDRLWQYIKFDSSTKLTKKETADLEKKEKKLMEETMRAGEEMKMDKPKSWEVKRLVPATIKPIKERNVTFRIKPKYEIKIGEERVKPMKSEPISLEPEGKEKDDSN